MRLLQRRRHNFGARGLRIYWYYRGIGFGHSPPAVGVLQAEQQKSTQENHGDAGAQYDLCS